MAESSLFTHTSVYSYFIYFMYLCLLILPKQKTGRAKPTCFLKIYEAWALGSFIVAHDFSHGQIEIALAEIAAQDLLGF